MEAPGVGKPLPETVIRSGPAQLREYFAELVRFRELLLFLVWKQMKVQYAQTSLGMGWLVLRPVLHATALTLIFGKLARFPSDGYPYPLFVLAGLVPWLYFVSSVARASSSIQSNDALLSKVYLPLFYLPLAPMLAGLVDFAVALLVYLGLAGAWYGRFPGLELLLLPVPLLLLLLTTLGAGLWLAAITVRFPDLRQLVGNLLQLLMFATPVIWPLSMVAQRWGIASTDFLQGYAYYPMVGVVQGFRAVLLTGEPLPWNLLAPGFATAVVLVVSGLLHFRRHQRHFVDLL